VGQTTGVVVGTGVGAELGATEGSGVGALVGGIVGAGVGFRVGSSVGSAVGERVGVGVGGDVGWRVGLAVRHIEGLVGTHHTQDSPIPTSVGHVFSTPSTLAVELKNTGPQVVPVVPGRLPVGGKHTPEISGSRITKGAD
jgi:hypothetical protein